MEFCFRAFTYVPPDKKDALFTKLKTLGLDAGSGDAVTKDLGDLRQYLTEEEAQIVEILRSRRMIREDPFDIDSFTLDTIDGLAPNLERGRLGLVKAKKANLDKAQFYSPAFLDGKVPEILQGSTRQMFAV